MGLLTAIRLKLKSRYNSIHNNSLKRNFLNALPFWLGAFMTGLFSVFYAKVFALAELSRQYIFGKASWTFFFITPICFFLSWWTVEKFAPYAKGSGIPQVSAAIELANPKNNHKVNILLNTKIIFIKIISSLVIIFGGGIIGREGPTIQISSAIFKKINDILPEWYPKISKRNMIVTGAAAGLASAFNTPLGGIVFAIEELTKTHFNFFKSALLTGVIIAGLTALNLSGPYLYIGYPKLSTFSAWIIFAIIPVSLISGLGGSGMGYTILYIFRRKKAMKKRSQHALFVIICGIIIAALAYFVDSRIFGSGKDIMQTTLFTGDKYLPWYTPVLRIFGSIASFSTGAAGGIFAPSLSAGASIGAAVSGLLHLSDTETNLLILCGMVGFLTGITRSPFTSSILVIEMTNDHNIIFYLMVAALLANIISNVVGKHSFYDHLKDQYLREINLNDAKTPSVG